MTVPRQTKSPYERLGLHVCVCGGGGPGGRVFPCTLRRRVGTRVCEAVIVCQALCKQNLPGSLAQAFGINHCSSHFTNEETQENRPQGVIQPAKQTELGCTPRPCLLRALSPHPFLPNVRLPGLHPWPKRVLLLTGPHGDAQFGSR